MHVEDWRVQPEALGPGTEVGSWRVVEQLGVGGYGAVYRVEDLACPGDFHALKLALRQGDERAEREVQLLMSRAVHPNVVRLHACGRWPHPRTGYLYFVMDWVPGPVLHMWVETVNPSFRLLAEKAGKVALALGALHDKGVLHRDFKPEHVLIREQDGEPVLIDFGVGRYTGADTVTSAVLPPATLHLLSPEAVRFFLKHSQPPGARYEARATDDLHALGVCLYRLVTGHWPFSPELPPDLLYMQLEAVVPSAPSDFHRRVPRALSDVIMRLLAKTPEARFQTGHAVQAALVAAVALGDVADWERTVFDWEDAPGADGETRRRVRRPEEPARSGPPPPRRLVPGPELPAPRLPLRRPRGVPAREQSPRLPGPRRRVSSDAAVLVNSLSSIILGTAQLSGAWRRGWPYVAVVVVALGFVTLGGMVLREGALPSRTEALHAAVPARVAGLPAGSSGREVASPDTGSAAAPPRASLPPAAVAAPATHAEDEAPVKKKTAAAPSTSATKPRTPGPGSMRKALCVGATSAALACAGTPVRADPPSESCPPGAVEAMEQLGIRIGSSRSMIFPGTRREVITVRDGYTEVRVMGPWDKLSSPMRLRGRLIIGEARVYGRMTEAHTPDGARTPVCMELYGTDDKRGLVIRPDSGPDSARVFSVGSVDAVNHFE
ncbi:serine/threonine protein kinase [Pyxidicoccus sp. MSG2]|uniref:serine/threonine protein kinase n=1 Tax=Pyxidicoccus sp. MSG2 TaxID=2996790 RepID=UPI00226D912B|nr:serine/threonine protein kinase [Pyxidicoccus sp. MSG2]MCY1022365.1 protein kinase [Pyxidicoccus sp. MSG2]